MPKEALTPSTSEATSATEVQSPLAHIFKIQTMRILALSADFSTISKEEPREQAIMDLPVAHLQNLPHALVSQILDVGRCHASLSFPNTRGTAFFFDTYHRDARSNNPKIRFLVRHTCILPADDPSMVRIPIVLHLLPLVKKALAARQFAGIVNAYFPASISPELFREESSLCLVLCDKNEATNILITIAKIGALPNRDWQLKMYSPGQPHLNLNLL